MDFLYDTISHAYHLDLYLHISCVFFFIFSLYLFAFDAYVYVFWKIHSNELHGVKQQHKLWKIIVINCWTEQERRLSGGNFVVREAGWNVLVYCDNKSIIWGQCHFSFMSYLCDMVHQIWKQKHRPSGKCTSQEIDFIWNKVAYICVTVIQICAPTTSAK